MLHTNIPYRQHRICNFLKAFLGHIKKIVQEFLSVFNHKAILPWDKRLSEGTWTYCQWDHAIWFRESQQSPVSMRQVKKYYLLTEKETLSFSY